MRYYEGENLRASNTPYPQKSLDKDALSKTHKALKLFKDHPEGIRNFDFPEMMGYTQKCKGSSESLLKLLTITTPIYEDEDEEGYAILNIDWSLMPRFEENNWYRPNLNSNR